MQMLHVAIGIQARSTSTRLPNKISQMVGGKMVIDHVIETCKNAAEHINRYSFTNHTTCDVYVLIPKNDPIKESLQMDSEHILEGSESDVLSRYIQMAEAAEATHVVRITADCPLIPPFLIHKCIISATKNGFDYFSNVGDAKLETSTSIDGHDVEVLSRAALDHIGGAAQAGPQREHVTLLLRGDSAPSWIRRGVLIGHNDHSGIKLSIDTQEDLDRVREEYDKIQKKVSIAKARYGKNAVHRY